MAENPVADTRNSERIWSEPLTDNERQLALDAFALDPDHAASKWGNFILKVLETREAVFSEPKPIYVMCENSERCPAQWHYFRCPKGKVAA